MATAQTTTQESDQSVYVADQDMVKTYPVAMSNNEINYDLHTTVRGKTPEDFYVNFTPLNEVQQAFKFIEIHGEDAAKGMADSVPGQFAKGAMSALQFEADYVDPAMKFLVSDPLAALGFSKDVNPQAVANTYKPWLDIWRESDAGQAATGVSDKALANLPLPVAAIPWFVAEFMPDKLLQFGTKASAWVGAYGVEKFGPPIINGLISKLPAPAREVLLKDIFAGEKALAENFQTLGISPNSKTSKVDAAFRQAARVTHPDVGGDPEEFIKVKAAYENIMKSRASWTDKLFDMFRGTPEFQAKSKPRNPAGLLGNERGSALIPFEAGDLVKMGDKIGQVIKISGEIAAVNIAGKVMGVKTSELSLLSKEGAPPESAIDPELEKKSAVNLKKMASSDDAKLNLIRGTDEMKDKIQNQTGKPITHEEVMAAAKEADLLTQGVSRETTLQFQASLLKTRQHLAALAEQNELTPEFLDALKITANVGTDIARSLESLKIDAIPEYAETKIKLVKDLLKLGKSADEILAASKGVDFNDEQAVAKFYRKFVKPKLNELVDEFVYMNILSSPITHIVNASSNLLQLAGLNPLTKLATGAVDFVASRLTGADRQHYISEVPDFYKGAINAIPEAFQGAVAAMKGKKNLERPDVKHLPTLSPIVDWATLKLGKYVTRALEASDVFFKTLIQGGEVEALTKKLGHTPDEKEAAKIQKEADARSKYYTFRNRPDSENKSGQGHVLSAIDKMTNAIYRLREVPGFKWFIRFVQTPMNIVKQGLEYSPAGFATLYGSKEKTEQAGKAIVGSMVFAGAAWLAANNLTTWAAPTSDKEKNEFYAAGMQPYSIRIGDHWVSYSKLGPLSYPIAMAAALHYFSKESPNALSDTEMDKFVDGLSGIMKFFSDQSYMQGLADLIQFSQGEKSKAISSIPSQLVPLSSLQGWVNNVLDPLQRKVEKGLTINSVLQNVEMKIVGMSKNVPPQLDSDQMPVKKQMKEVNAISPAKISKVDKGALAEYREGQQIKQEVNKAKKEAKAENA